MNKIIIKELHIHEASRVDEMKMLKRLELLIGRVMTTVNELSEKLNAVNAQLTKAKDEIVNQIDKLIFATENVELPSEAREAIIALEATAQALDDLNPDATPDVPAEENPVTEDQPVQ